MVKIETLFQTKTAKKHTLWCGTYLYSLYKGLPPGVKNALPIVSLAAYASKTNKRTKTTKQIYQADFFPEQKTRRFFVLCHVFGT